MTLATLALIASFGLTESKPVFLNLDSEFGHSALIAEVELMEVKIRINRVLEELDELGGEHAAAAAKRLTVLASKVTPPVPIPAAASLDDVTGPWRTRVEPPVYAQRFLKSDARKDFVFSDPRVWTVHAAAEGGWLQHVPGHKYKTPQRSPFNISLVADWTFGDFVLECEMLQTGREYGHRDQCLFFGFQDPKRFYYVHISTKADKNAHNVFIVNQKPRRSFAAETTKGIDWGKDKWHKVRLERKGEDITVWFDDMKKPIMRAKDKTHGRGWLGFGSFDDEGKVRDVKVWCKDAKRARTTSFRTDAPKKK